MINDIVLSSTLTVIDQFIEKKSDLLKGDKKHFCMIPSQYQQH